MAKCNEGGALTKLPEAAVPKPTTVKLFLIILIIQEEDVWTGGTQPMS